MTSSFYTARHIIYEFEYSNNVDEPELGLDDVMFDDLQDDDP